MGENSPHHDRETLKSFYEYILSGIRQTTKYDFYQKSFIFAHELITRNRVSEKVDFILNFMIFFIMDIFTVTTCYPAHFFKHLIPPSILGESDIAHYSQKIIIRYATVLISVLSLLSLFIPLYIYFNFTIGMKLKSKHATLSYAILEYIPLLLTPIQGYLFGALALTTIADESISKAEPLAWIFNGIVFVLYIFSTVIWRNTTYYQLTIKKGYFGTFIQPYDFIDVIVSFLISAVHPFLSSPFAKYGIVILIMMTFYGAYKLFYSGAQTYTSNFGEILHIKLKMDYIIFGIFSTAAIILARSAFILIPLGLLLYFLSLCLSNTFINFYHSNAREGTTSLFDIKNTPTDTSAIAKVRYACIHSCPEIADISYLNDIAQTRSSMPLLVDITRICLVKGIDLDDIQIKVPIITPNTRSSLYFLAHQVNIFMHSFEDDSEPTVQSLADHLKKATEKVADAMKKFWTDLDDDHRTIRDMWELISETNAEITLAILRYPQSKVIKQIGEDYFLNILKDPVKAKRRPLTTLSLLREPAGTVFNFLKPNAQPPESVDEDSPVDKYLNGKLSRALKPLYIATISIYILSFFLIVMFARSYNKHFNRICVDTGTAFDLLNTTNTLMTNFLASADSSFTQPSVERIIEVLAFSDSDASDLRSKFPRSPNVPSIVKWLKNLEHNSLSFDPRIPNCRKVSFILSMHESDVRDSDPHTRLCYSVVMSENIHRVFPYLETIVEKRHNDFKGIEKSTYIAVVALLAVFVAFWCVVMYNFWRYKTTVLEAVRRATIFNEHRCEYADSTPLRVLFPFSYIIAVAVILFFVTHSYFLMLERAEKHLSAKVEQVVLMGRIGYLYQQALSFILFYLPKEQNDDLARTIYKGIVHYASRNMSLFTEKIVELAHEYGQVPVFDDPEERDRLLAKIREFAQVIITNITQADSYPFLYARHLAMHELSVIQRKVLPKMINHLWNEIECAPSRFWWMTIIAVVLLTMAMLVIINFLAWNKGWMRASNILIRCTAFDDNDRLKNVIDILENREPNYVDDFPFPTVIRRTNGAIVACNSKILSFTPHSKAQIIGNMLENFFGEIGDKITVTSKEGKKVTMDVQKYKCGKNHEIIIFKDITDLVEAEARYAKLLERLTLTGMDIPYRGPFFVLRHRFQKAITEENFKTISALEEQYDIIRISITITSYIVIAKPESDPLKLIEFSQKVSEIVNDAKSVIACVVKGTISIVPLVGKAIPVLCGPTAEKALNLMINGKFGVLHVDNELIPENTEIEKLSTVLQVNTV